MEHNMNHDYKTCPTCRKEIGYFETVCPHCGQTFQVEVTDDRIPYIKSNVDTYLKKFGSMERKNSILSWNWCAFLFSTSWMVYRKMYGLGVGIYLGFLAAGAGLGVILALLSSTEDGFYLAAAIAGIVLNIAMCVIPGLLGDHWYRNRIEKLTAQGRTMIEGQEKEKHVKKGGTSIIALIIFLILTAAVELLMDKI